MKMMRLAVLGSTGSIGTSTLDVAARHPQHIQVVALSALHGVAAPAFMSSLGYYDAYRSARLPANLLQAQRDYFGAHTYQRTDRPGKFHTRWQD